MNKNNNVLYYEEVIEKIENSVIRSKIRVATEKEINEVKRLYKLGKCPHTIIKDEPGYVYDIRYCAICTKYLGTI